MKRVLILATTPFLNDGLTKVMMDIYRYNRNNVQMDFATSFFVESKYRAEIEKNGDAVYKLNPKKNVLSYMYSIWKLIREKNFDVIYIHGNSAMMLIEALPCKLGGAKRIIAHCHNTRTKHPIFHYIFKPIFNIITDEKIGCSDLAARWAFWGKYQVVMNGIDTSRLYYNQNVRNNVRNELGWQNQFIIGHVGRFNYQKNHKFLIDIFNEIIKIKPNARLLLIGEGELKEDICEIVKRLDLAQYVNFFGTTEHIERYYQAMDVFLLPSLFEGLPLVALEAQCSGLPTLLADSISSETIIIPTTFMMSLSDLAEEWARKICQLDCANRCDYVSIFKERQLDFESMMNKISMILTGDK